MTKEQNRKKLTKGKKILLIILCCFLSVVLLISTTLASLYFYGKKLSTSKDVVITPTDNILADIDDDNIVTYNGKKYKYNEDITTVLCVGVDNAKLQNGDTYVTGKAGQADAIYLIAIDTATGKTRVIGIPRDSMTDIDLYSSAGKFIGSEKKQICLSYAYGDGKDGSAQNTAKAVSRLLYGMPVNSYFVIDDDSMAPLQNAVGDITVIPNETIEKQEVEFNKGEPFVITGKNAYKYLKARNETSTNASLLRLERQIDYLKKYSAKAISKTKNDLSFPVKLYNKVVNNVTTDINVSKVTFLASCILKEKENVNLDFVQIKGEQIKGEGSYAEFYPDETALFEMVLDIFYSETV